jgi:hypothetical protein
MMHRITSMACRTPLAPSSSLPLPYCSLFLGRQNIRAAEFNNDVKALAWSLLPPPAPGPPPEDPVAVLTLPRAMFGSGRQVYFEDRPVTVRFIRRDSRAKFPVKVVYLCQLARGMKTPHAILFNENVSLAMHPDGTHVRSESGGPSFQWLPADEHAAYRHTHEQQVVVLNHYARMSLEENTMRRRFRRDSFWPSDRDTKTLTAQELHGQVMDVVEKERTAFLESPALEFDTVTDVRLHDLFLPFLPVYYSRRVYRGTGTAASNDCIHNETAS